MNGWTVDLSTNALRQYRRLERAPKSEAQAVIEAFEAEGPAPAFMNIREMDAYTHTFRVRFYRDAYRMVYQVSTDRKRILVTKIHGRTGAYDGLKHPGPKR